MMPVSKVIEQLKFALDQVSKMHSARINELLEANNRELYRRRALQVAVRNVLNAWDQNYLNAHAPEVNGVINVLRERLIDCMKNQPAPIGKPYPVAYTFIEGGVWHEWERNRSAPVFAVKFSDGSIYDPIVGWR